MSKQAYPLEMQKGLVLSNEKKLAFVISKSTGVMTLTFTDIPESICLNPLVENKNYYAVRAAFLSWGYLLRRSVASYLDIDASELSIGYHVSSITHKPEIFIVERLENGSGYCNFLSGRKYKNVPFEAIIKPLIEGGTLYKFLCSPSHLENCMSSCYDCIRDYSNQQEHQILDWRLGLDMAKIAFDQNACIDFDTIYWKQYIETNIALLLSKRNLKLEKDGNLYAAYDSNHDLIGIIVHPLWSEMYIKSVINKYSLSFDVQQISVFELGKITIK